MDHLHHALRLYKRQYGLDSYVWDYAHKMRMSCKPTNTFYQGQRVIERKCSYLAKQSR